VIPFRFTLQPGVPVSDQVVYAAKKAIVSGQMREGEAFPSVRALSKALKINPNTAHKVITLLLHEGLLEVQPGIGTVVATPRSSSADRGNLLKKEVEQLVVEAKKLGLALSDVTSAVESHWNVLDANRRDSRRRA
jgi:GntR family transcriptional regulator